MHTFHFPTIPDSAMRALTRGKSIDWIESDDADDDVGADRLFLWKIQPEHSLIPSNVFRLERRGEENHMRITDVHISIGLIHS